MCWKTIKGSRPSRGGPLGYVAVWCVLAIQEVTDDQGSRGA